MSSGSVFSRDPVKVVIINTQYVETDALSFKSVVQRLTGKDSKIEFDPSSNSFSSSSSTANSSSSASAGLHFNSTSKLEDDLRRRQQLQQPWSSAGASVPVMGRGLSFKDFDRMLKELPPLDELFRLCAE